MITKQTRALSLLILSLAGATVGCGDPQADDSYVGEPLLSIQGSIRTTSDRSLTGDIVPALAWAVDVDQGDFEHVVVQETEVRGEFPNSFTMNLVSPPPAEALYLDPIKGFESEPAVYYGYILAVPAAHDQKLVLGYERSPVEEECDLDENGHGECVSTYCDYYDQCFTERCQRPGWECTLTEGEPEVRAGLGKAAGFVEDYAVIYLDRPARRGSVTAFMWGVEELAAGFHLVDFNGVEEEFSPADFECFDAADVQARADFEAAYGVSAAENDDDDDQLREALWMYEQAAHMAAGCKPEPDGRIVEKPKGLVMNLGGLDDA